MSISISLKNNNEAEQKTKELLETLLSSYNIGKWILCNDIVIEQGARGKAFPVIRLSAWKPGGEDGLLAQFLHEQIHWIEKGKESEIQKVIEELKILFPNAPIERPEGGGNETSTYKHLIVCRLEYLALKNIFGEDRAKEIVLGNTNYAWIRRTVIEKSNIIDPVVKKYFPSISSTNS
jgi:hypothetical protein